MFTYKDIQWVRNVKREKGEKLAYLEENTKDEFILQWSDRYANENEALKPRIGDIILMFQHINKFRGIQLTHLVTPINNDYVDCSKESKEFPWGRKVKVIARVENGYNPKPNDLKFGSVSRTHSFRIEKIKTEPYKSEVDLQKQIWNAFNDFFKKNLDDIYFDILEKNTRGKVLGASEGAEKEVVRRHILRERSSSLVIEKKRQALQEGKLFCECCDFDFSKTYLGLGDGFIECHHRIPIHKGERITDLKDLALVCANCHRMLHRKNKDNTYYSVKGLKDLIEKNKI